MAVGLDRINLANDSVNWVDPWGLTPAAIGMGGAGGVASSGFGVGTAGYPQLGLTPGQSAQMQKDLGRIADLMDPRPLAKDIVRLFQDDSGLYPPGPITPEDIREKTEEMEEQLAKSKCEEGTPWMGPGKGYDPNDPGNDPKAPLWKKIVRAIMDLVRASNP
ncbi:hypothetical protein DSCA_25180 [Desulfosarcina alkanivorans]|uniref:Uncharacterized protein n=1 Tax=Desulfosarcina alkanivorans TaxID=571177 RepID=A0A5K7YI16_9BACT|nr:hypothetical protein [Desulfosarcina alkanivorans]BBO68588.1 hypothetical protein DSCA_25180 [Desulfosarcina alkanivorans]